MGEQRAPDRIGHTLGPWRIGYHDETEADALAEDPIVICAGTDVRFIPEPIAEVPYPGGVVELREEDGDLFERVRADARLIASAPDMLAALREILGYYEQEYREGDKAYQAAIIARAAIDAATREE